MAQIGVHAPALSASIIGWLTKKNTSLAQPSVWLVYLLVLVVALVASRFDYPDLFRNPWFGGATILVAGLAVCVFIRSGPGDPSWYTTKADLGLGWLLMAVFLVPLVMVLSMLFANGRISLSPLVFGTTTGMKVLAVAIVLFSFNLLLGGSVGEEPGWRGLALPLLLQKHRPLMASVILGVIWALKLEGKTHRKPESSCSKLSKPARL